MTQWPDDDVILYDGVCIFCSRWVRFAATRDTARRFRFTAIQSPYGTRLAQAFGIDPDDPDTNAVVHGGSQAEVSVVLLPNALRVEVGDSDPSVPQPKAAEDDWATSGRGLALVESMSKSWGIETFDRGKVIWFEVARPDA